MRFPNRFTILQPPAPLASVVEVASAIRFGVLVGTTGFGFSTTVGGGITSGFGGRSSMFFSTAGLICGGDSGGGVASGLEGGVDDCFGVVVAVILGCTTAAFLPLASSGVGGFEELL